MKCAANLPGVNKGEIALARFKLTTIGITAALLVGGCGAETKEAFLKRLEAECRREFPNRNDLFMDCQIKGVARETLARSGSADAAYQRAR